MSGANQDPGQDAVRWTTWSLGISAFAAAISGGLLAQGVPGDPASPESRAARAVQAELFVEDAEQFCPVVIRFVYRSAEAASEYPVCMPRVEFQREVSEGRWQSVEGPPEGPPTTAGPSAGPIAHEGTAPEPVWRSGEQFAIAFELSDWRVLAFPGNYRAIAHWIPEGRGLAGRQTTTAQFVVRAAGPEGADLVRALAAKSAVWSDYVAVMNQIRRPQVAQVPVESISVAPKDPVHPLLAQWVEYPGAHLQKVRLPSALRSRLGVQRAVWAWETGRRDPDVQLRASRMDAALEEMRQWGREPGISGIVARAQLLLCQQATMEPDSYATVLDAARRDPSVVEFFQRFPDQGEVVGLAKRSERSKQPPPPVTPRQVQSRAGR